MTPELIIGLRREGDALVVMLPDRGEQTVSTSQELWSLLHQLLIQPQETVRNEEPTRRKATEEKLEAFVERGVGIVLGRIENDFGPDVADIALRIGSSSVATLRKASKQGSSARWRLRQQAKSGG